jgi:hypothetical protein
LFPREILRGDLNVFQKKIRRDINTYTTVYITGPYPEPAYGFFFAKVVQ